MIYVSYIRVSTKRQGDSGLGLEAQQDIIKHYYKDIAHEFLEIGSGKNVTDRPVLKQAVKFCKDNMATLVVAKVDRLSRDVIDGLTILKELNGRVEFFDLPGSVDKLILTMFFAFAEREREIIGIRTRAALNRKRERGEPMGTNLPQCKDNLKSLAPKQVGADKIKQRAIKNKDNRQAYSLAKDLRDAGISYGDIVKKLNQEHNTSTGGKWHTGSVYRLLERMG